MAILTVDTLGSFSHPPTSSGIFIVVSLFIFSSLLLWTISAFVRLKHVPGPLLASLTNLPLLSWVYGNQAGEKHTALHRQYGSIVRFGPNMISVFAHSETGTIYDMHGRFPKSDFYLVLSFYVKGKAIPGLFATQDRRIHTLLRKPIAGLYSMTSLVSYELMVDSTIRVFFEQLDRRFGQTGRVCDTWMSGCRCLRSMSLARLHFRNVLDFSTKDGTSIKSWRTAGGISRPPR